MTKTTKLNWRLKELPDAVDVAELVDKKVITPEEARELLFNDSKDDSTKIKELEEEIKFLRELCDKLAAKSNGWTTIVKEYHDYRPHYPQWYATYASTVNTMKPMMLNQRFTGAAVGTATVGTVTTTNNMLGLSSLNK